MDDRARLYDALTNPKTAADYGETMSVEDFWAEAKARGEQHPWLPTPAEIKLANERQAEMAKLGRAMANHLDAMIADLFKP